MTSGADSSFGCHRAGNAGYFSPNSAGSRRKNYARIEHLRFIRYDDCLLASFLFILFTHKHLYTEEVGKT